MLTKGQVNTCEIAHSKSEKIMSQAVAEKLVASGVKNEDLLRVALRSQQGLEIFLGRVAGRSVFKPQTIFGELLCYKESIGIVGFRVEHSGSLSRSYQMTDEENIKDFLHRMALTSIHDFENDGFKLIIDSQFDCPNG